MTDLAKEMACASCFRYAPLVRSPIPSLALCIALLAACASESPATGSQVAPSASAPVPAPVKAAAPVKPQPSAAPAYLVPPPGFLGAPESVVLDRLVQGSVRSIKKGKGGRSLAFKLTLDNGAAGYFKPEQTFSGTLWFAEVVAHALDRALGIGRVPPTVSRRLAWKPLAEVARDDEREREVIVDGDGQVRGALIAWLDAPLTPAVTPPGWENWVRVEPWPPFAITPFQRASEYVEALDRQRALSAEGKGGPAYYTAAPKPARDDLPGALSDMLLLDFLTMNIDRFGGGNGNVLTLGASGPLIFLDNAAGFSEGPHRRSLPDQRFFPCQRFRKATIAALEALDVAAFGRALERDPQAPLLNARLLEGLAERRSAALAHVAQLRQKHGDAAVLAWP